MKTMAQLLVALVVAACCAHQGRAVELVIGDGSAIHIPIRADGTGRFAEEFDQDGSRHKQHAFAVEGEVVWRARRWKDLAFQGSRVVYKVVCSRQVTTLTLSFAFWGSQDTEAIAWASPDGSNWTQVFAYTAEEMGTTVRLRRTVDLSAYLSPRTHTVFVRMGTNTKWGLLYGFSLAALQHAGAELPGYTPGPVPRSGGFRSGTEDGPLDKPALDFIRKAGINTFHWHGPFAECAGIPERSALDALIATAGKTITDIHERGAPCLLRLRPCLGYGDVETRTQLFGFYDRRWKDYVDYVGSPPGDLLTMAQCSPDGKPRPYVHGKQEGYHLCVNSPGVRQYTMGLIRMMCEAGGDGNVFAGLRIAEGNCYCEWCRFRFREWLGQTYEPSDLQDHFGVSQVGSASPPTSPSDRLREPWRRFAAWSLLDFLRAMKTYGRSINPHYIMSAGYGIRNGEPFSPLQTSAEDVELWSPVLDIVSGESRYGAGPRTEKGTKISNSVDYRYLAAAARGKPVALLKTTPDTDRPRARSALTRLAIAEGVANGGSWQCHELSSEAQQAAAAYHAFLRRRQTTLIRVRPWSPVRMWASLQQTYQRMATFPMPCSRYLVDRHVPHLMLVDRDLTNAGLQDVEALIIPTARIVSDEQLTALRECTEAGLGIVLVGPCATHDEWGDVRQTSWISQALAVESEWPDKPRRIDFGRGRVAYLPAPSLPEAANAGLSREAEAGLAGLEQALVHVSRRPLPAAVDTGANVEVSISYDGANTLLVHLVNYAVDLGGAVEGETALPVKVRLPKGKSVKRAVFVSPDEDTPPHWLPFTILTPGPARCVEVVIPGLEIYGQIEYELVDETPVWERLPLLHVSQERPAAPGGEVVLQLALSRRLAAGWRVEGPEGWTFRFEGMTAGETRCIAMVPADATRGRHPLDLAVGNRGMGTLSDRVWIRVEAPLELTLHAPPHVDTASRRTRVLALIDSRLTEPIEADMTVTLPPGWPAPSPIHNLSILPGRATPVKIWVQNPVGVKPGTYPMGIRFVSAGHPPLEKEIRLQVLDGFCAIACSKLHEEIALDGSLHEPCWRPPPHVSHFVRNDNGAPAGQQTRAWAAYDSTTLYIAVACADSEPESIVARQDAYGGDVWCDDSIEVFLDRGHGHQTFSQFIVNGAGAKQPAEGWQAVAQRTESGWTVEIAIPLPVPPEPGEMWGLNLCRNRPARPQSPAEHSTWAPLEGTFHQPGRFRHLVFAR